MSSRIILLKSSIRALSPALTRTRIPARRNHTYARSRCLSVVSHPWKAQRPLHVRWQSSTTPRPKEYRFEEVKALVESPSLDKILIDVREPDEYAAGFIPTALNMPITSHPDALFLAPEDFRDRFGFPKPPPSKEVVFYCKAGVRSSTAAQLALQHGYERVGEYRGSWLDWERRKGEESKDSRGQGAGQGVPGGE